MQISEPQLVEASEALRRILNGCLNNNTIKQSEQQLMNISNDPHFITYLCYLIPSADANLLSMILTTLKNYTMARYNSRDNPMPQWQKDFLRNNIFKIFYQLYPQVAPIKIYKEIMHILILVSYPWPSIDSIIEEDLQGGIVASVYFFRQVTKANQYTTDQERKEFQQFISRYFPNLQAIIEKIFTNYNQSTAELLYQALKAFYSAIHIEVPYHLRSWNVMDKWVLFTQTILNAPSEPMSIKSQQLAARIYLKLFMLYANDSQDGKEFKGWAATFRERYCSRVFQHVINLIGERKGGDDLQSTLVNCLYQVVKQNALQYLFTLQHGEVLIYGNVLLPLCQSTQQELNHFRNDPIEYVHRQDDLTCAPLRRAILDLVQCMADRLSFNGKSELMHLVQHSASILQPNTSDQQKEVILRVLSKIGKMVLKNSFLKSRFQALTVQYFIPMLNSPNPLLASLTLDLLSRYLPFGELDNQTVGQLMELIYGHITNSQFLVLRFYAISAFTALLRHRAALEAAAPHFSRILEIYVSMLNSFQHESLIGCLESIVKYFSNEVVTYAPELISHLIHLFASLCKNKNEQGDDDEDEPDSNTPANAALSTITQILECSLSPETYHKISGEITELFRGIFSSYSEYFDSILSLFNVLVHRATAIVDFNYPYVACRKLLEGDNSLLQNAQLPHEIALELSNAEKADSQLQEDIISILKNLIQKMPDEILRRYPFPRHPQLLLCLIQNKRLSNQDIFNLNTSEIVPPWLPYIYAYTNLLYGIGEGPAPINQIKQVVGISLFPWFQQGLTPDLVKIIIKAYETQEEAEDDLYQENTEQLLEKYANQDEDEDQDDYNEGSEINYAYHYDSPFDSSKDKDNLVQALKSLSQNDALALSNALPAKYRKKLQTLFY